MSQISTAPRPRTATLLFTDLVGYSAMAVRLGAASDELLRSYFDLLRGAVAATGGTEVKSLGDGIMAAFESATASVECALAIQQSVDRHNRRSAERLETRVGVSAGDVVIDRGDYYGIPAIEAARLCAVAEGGQILVAESVRIMVSGRDEHTFTRVGDLNLKGLDAPVATWEVPWKPLTEPKPIPLPQALERSVQTGSFVGRAAELEILSQRWELAVTGSRQAVFVAGEPGIGKTRLVAEHACLVHAAGGTVLYGECQRELRNPFAPLVTALRRAVAAVDADLLGDHVRKHGGELARLVPELESRVPDVPPARTDDPETERFRLFEAVDGVLVGMAGRSPLLVVLDDLHWADKPTLILLRHLLRGADAPLLFACTYREAPRERDEALGDFLGEPADETRSRWIRLAGLAEKDTLRLLEATPEVDAGEEGAALARALHQETDGNPFFTRELLRHIGHVTHALQDDGRRWSSTENLELPGSVRDAVLSRVERLGPEAAGVLQSAAVIGRDFDFELLREVLALPEDALLEVLERARDAALVSELGERPGRFSFSHALIQHALAEEVGAVRRQRLHGRLAEALESVAGHDPRRLGELAHHWIASNDPVRGRQAAIRAGDEALTLLAPDEAVRWYRHALELLLTYPNDDEASHIDILIRLGDAERRAGSIDFHEHLIDAGERARKLGDSERLARAALADNRGMYSRPGSIDVERVKILEAALDAVGAADSARRALLLATLSSELWLGDHDRRMTLSNEALAIARRIADERLLAEVLYRRCLTIAEPGTLFERLDLTAELLELTDRLGDSSWRCLASAERGRAAIESGDIDEGLYHAQRQRRLAGESGNAYARHVAAWSEPWPHALAGAYDEAERAAAQAFTESMSSRQPDAVAIYGYVLSLIRCEQGRVDEILEAVAQVPASGEALASHQALLAYLLGEAGRLDDAREVIARAALEDFPLPLDAIWLTGTVLWADACARVGDAEGAATLLERLLPWKDQVAFTGLAVHGAVAGTAGLLAAMLDRPDAEDLFAHAERAHVRLRAPVLVAHTRLDWGAWLLKSRDAPRGRRLVQQARNAAAAFTAKALLARCDEVLDNAPVGRQ
jgi:class 3 adenylate cyclase/tetratricopeptide (TPR) repeat protein